MNSAAEDSKPEELDSNLSEQNDHENAKIQEDKTPDFAESSEFALKMINAVKSMNLEEITHYEMVNSFALANELKCLFMFIKALPYSPIIPMYPETPFLFFKGVPLPRSFDLSEEMANDIETFMKGQNSDYIAAALNEYKNNIERGPQSALMYAQAAALSESDIKELSNYIVTL